MRDFFSLAKLTSCLQKGLIIIDRLLAMMKRKYFALQRHSQEQKLAQENVLQAK
jgi:hypothetical protein